MERTTFQRVDSLKRRLDAAISEACNLRGEIGVLRNRLVKAEGDALKTVRRASEAARLALAKVPRVDEIFILGGTEVCRSFPDTMRMELHP